MRELLRESSRSNRRLLSSLKPAGIVTFLISGRQEPNSCRPELPSYGFDGIATASYSRHNLIDADSEA
jgi:hypothetical protein